MFHDAPVASSSSLAPACGSADPLPPCGTFQASVGLSGTVKRSRRGAPTSFPVLTRCDERWSTGVASFSQEDLPDTMSPDPPQPASLRVNLDKATRWGRCPKHECRHALRPHIFRSGKTPGKLVLLCSRWFNVTQGKRDCWGQVDFPMHKFGDLPAFLKRDYSSIRQALGRGSHA